MTRESSRTLAFVGSWTSELDSAVSDGGIRVFDLRADGSLTPLSEAAAPELSAGYLALSPSGRVLYAVDERRDSPRSGFVGGGIASFAVDPATGSLSQLRLTATAAALPCFVSVSPAGDLVAVANHGSYGFVVKPSKCADGFVAQREFDAGAVTLLQVAADGSVDRPADVAILEGREAGTRARVLTDPTGQFTAEFQASSHPHAAVFHPTEPILVATDKGADAIVVFAIDRERRTLSMLQRCDAEPGTGPRHARFHPTLPVVYVANELLPSILVLAWDFGCSELRPIQTVSTVPEPGDAVIWPSELVVHPSGRFVYVSNRGHGSITAFAVQPDGSLVFAHLADCRGRTPRAFGIDPDGDWLLALNQESGMIRNFTVDAGTGALSATGAVAYVERPVSVAMGRYQLR